jgi:hypothetical protein
VPVTDRGAGITDAGYRTGSRTVVDQFREDIARNKRASPFAIVGGSWFGGNDFVERFAFFFQSGDAAVMVTSISRYSVSSVLPPILPCPGMTIVLSVALARFDPAALIIPLMFPPVE